MSKYDIDVELTGQDGNAFAIIGNVARAIRKEVGIAESEAFSEEAMNQGSYDELLRLCMRTVNVS